MVTWLHGVADYLDSQIAEIDYRPTTGGGNLYVERNFPDSPDLCFRLIGSGGFEVIGSIAHDEPTFQILGRAGAGDQETGRLLCESIFDVMQAATGVDLDDGSRLGKSRGLQSGPIFIGEDENGRPRWSLNFAATLERSAATLLRE